MRLSAFNQYLEDWPEPGDTLVRNTFSGAYVVLPSAEVRTLRRVDAGAAVSAADRAIAREPDLCDPAVAIVVSSRAEEEAEYQRWFERRRSRRTLRATIGVNLACNFRCTYCCQAGAMNGAVMTPDTADRVADWLARRARETGADAISLAFVGGEPLLHTARIARIAAAVRAAVVGIHTQVRFSLITNGYFLTRETLDDLIPLGLAGAQVTLDGDHTTHSRTRVAKSGVDTFARVFENAITASRRIEVSINGNYQDDTIAGFGPLVSALRAAGLPRGSRVSFSPALAGLDAPAGSGSSSCTWYSADAGYRTALHDLILASGFATAPLDAIGPCSLHDQESFAIDTEGLIYECPGFLGHPEWAVGSVVSGVTDRHARLLARAANPEECAGCAHRPSCGGGCLATRWIQSGCARGVSCARDYFEAVRPEALPRGFLLATCDSPEEAAAAFPALRLPLPEQPAGATRPTRSMTAPAIPRVHAAI